MLKLAGGLTVFLSTSIVIADDSVSTVDNQTISENTFDGFLNLKAGHERKNNYAFGPKNTSGIAVTPFIQYKNFTFDADLYYGRQFKYAGALTGLRDQAQFVGDIAEFADAYYDKKLGKKVKAGYKNGQEKAHFYRNYTRAIYSNNKKDFKVMVGDTATRNTIGFQRIVSGMGVSIFRQGGNGSTVNPGLPIVVTHLSKAEVRLNGEILLVKILRPGVYTVDQIGPEALLPGAKVKISDQLSRSETFNIAYFSGYDMPELGKDDFDITVACSSKYNLDDPYRVRYEKKPRFSGNYRRTFRENTTYTVGAQMYEKAWTLDAGLIFNTLYGKIAPNIGYSNTRQAAEKNAFAGSLYYATPANDYGIFFEACASVMSKGYGSLSFDEETVETYNEYIDKYFSDDADLKKKITNSSDKGSSRQIIARVYTKPIWNITPAFIFKGNWVTKTARTRDYTIALMTKVLEKCNITVSGGLTYDDPGKGYNRKSPDRRFTVACAVDINSEWSAKYTYGQYYDDMRRNYGSITFKPEAIKGLELNAEYTRKPGLSNPLFSASYDCKYFNAKVEENIANTYDDKGSKTRKSHSNSQRFTFGTSLSKDGMRAHRKVNANIIRTMKDYKK
jgi:outer membrane usher protein FimD/PapC